MSRPLRIALTKGRLEKDTLGLLESLGYDCSIVRNKGRRLILPIPNGNMEVVLAKANDVITYVEHGVCDLGVVGKDTIMEMQGKFYELLDLGFGRCKFALAVKKGTDFYSGFSVKNIATKYPNVSRSFFEAKGNTAVGAHGGLGMTGGEGIASRALDCGFNRLKIRVYYPWAGDAKPEL